MAQRDGSSLRAYAQRRAAEHGIDLTGGRVLLLCYPRLLGYTFNPLSVYFCYRADGELALDRSTRCATPSATSTLTCCR